MSTVLSYTSLLNQAIGSDDFNSLEKDERGIVLSEFKDSFISKYGDTMGDNEKSYINDYTEKRLSDYRIESNEPRFVPSQEEFELVAPPLPVFNQEESIDDRVAKIDDWKIKTSEAFSKNRPAEKEDIDIYLNGYTNNLIREVAAEKNQTSFGGDYAKRFTEGLVRPISSLAEFAVSGDTETTDRFFAENLIEDPKRDEDIGSQVAGGVGDAIGQVALVLGATALSSPAGGVTASTVYNTSRYMQQGYQEEFKRSGDTNKAINAAVSQIPAAALETIGDTVMAGLGKTGRGFAKAFAEAATEAEKRAILSKAIPSLTKDATKQFLTEALPGGIGAEWASGMGMYQATGNEDYLRSGEELLKSGFVEGMAGLIVGTPISRKFAQPEATAKVANELGALTQDVGKNNENLKKMQNDIFSALQDRDFNRAIELTNNKLISDPALVKDRLEEYDASRGLFTDARGESTTTPQAKPDTSTDDGRRRAFNENVGSGFRQSIFNEKNPESEYSKLSAKTDRTEQEQKRLDYISKVKTEIENGTYKPGELSSIKADLPVTDLAHFGPANNKFLGSYQVDLDDGTPLEQGDADNNFYITGNVAAARKQITSLQAAYGEVSFVPGAKEGVVGIAIRDTDGKMKTVKGVTFPATFKPTKGSIPVKVRDSGDNVSFELGNSLVKEAKKIPVDFDIVNDKLDTDGYIEIAKKSDPNKIIRVTGEIAKSTKAMYQDRVGNKQAKKDAIETRKREAASKKEELRLKKEEAKLNKAKNVEAAKKQGISKEELASLQKELEGIDVQERELIEEERTIKDLEDQLALEADEIIDDEREVTDTDPSIFDRIEKQEEIQKSKPAQKQKPVANTNTTPTVKTSPSTQKEQTITTLKSMLPGMDSKIDNLSDSTVELLQLSIARGFEYELMSKEAFVEFLNIPQAKTGLGVSILDKDTDTIRNIFVKESLEFLSQENFEKVLVHETFHGAAYRVKGMNPELWNAATKEILQDSDINKFMSAEYPKWDTLDDNIKTFETIRAINEGRYTGSVSGSSKLGQLLQQFLNYIGKIFGTSRNKNIQILTRNVEEFLGIKYGPDSTVERVGRDAVAIFNSVVRGNDLTFLSNKDITAKQLRDISSMLKISNNVTQSKENLIVRIKEYQDNLFPISNGEFNYQDVQFEGQPIEETEEQIQSNETFVENPTEENITNITNATPALDLDIEQSITEEDKSIVIEELGGKTWDDVKNSFKKQFASFVSGVGSFSDALINVFNNIIKTLKTIAFTSVLAFTPTNSTYVSSVPQQEVAAFNANLNQVQQKEFNSLSGGLPDAKLNIPGTENRMSLPDGMNPSPRKFMPSGISGVQERNFGLNGIPQETLPTGTTNNSISVSRSNTPITIEANFFGAKASRQVTDTANWILKSGNNEDKPFVVADKRGGMLYAFDANGELSKKTPALFGQDVGDKANLNSTFEDERASKVTPTGRFSGEVVSDAEYGDTVDFLQSNADWNLAIHKTYLGNESEQRLERLSSEDVKDNRISYGCINCPENVMKQNIIPLFKKDGGFVYVLPETKKGANEFVNQTGAPANAVFAQSGQFDTVTPNDVDNITIKGNYGAWINPNGTLTKVKDFQNHDGVAQKINKNKTPISEVTGQLLKEGYLRVTNRPEAIVVQSYNVNLTSSVKRTLEFLGMNDEKNVIQYLPNGSEKKIYDNDAITNKDINFAQQGQFQPSALEEIEIPGLLGIPGQVTEQRKAKLRQLQQIKTAKVEARLMPEEKEAFNALRNLKNGSMLTDDSFNKYVSLYQEFVDTRRKTKTDAIERTPIGEVLRAAAEFKLEADQNMFAQLQEEFAGIPAGEGKTLGDRSFESFNNDLDLVRILIQESANLENIFESPRVSEMRESFLERIDMLRDMNSEDLEGFKKQAMARIDEVQFMQDPGIFGWKHIAKGIGLMNDSMNELRKFYDAYVDYLMNADVDALSDRQVRDIYYSLMGVTYDSYMLTADNFISGDTMSILRNSNARFTSAFSEDRDARKFVRKASSYATEMRRIAADRESLMALQRLTANFNESIKKATQFHQEVMVKYHKDAEKSFESKSGRKMLDSDRWRLGIIARALEIRDDLTPEQAAKGNRERLMHSFDQYSVSGDKTLRAASASHRGFTELLFEGAVGDNANDIIRQNANRLLGKDAADLFTYYERLKEFFDVFEPMSKFTTEFVYGRQYHRYTNYMPSMVIDYSKGVENSRGGEATMNMSHNDLGEVNINKTGMASTHNRVDKLSEGQALILNINHLFNNRGRLNFLDYFTSVARREMSEMINKRGSVANKALADFLGDPRGQNGRLETFASAQNTKWNNIITSTEYIHPHMGLVNNLAGRWAGGVLSSAYQFLAQTASNIIPYLQVNIMQPGKMVDFFSAMGMLTKYRAGMLEPKQQALFDKLLFDIENRKQDVVMDTSVALNPSKIKDFLKQIPGYSTVEYIDQLRETAQFLQFKWSDILGGMPIVLTEYLHNVRKATGNNTITFENLDHYDPASYFAALDEAERFIAIGDTSRRGEFLNNRKAMVTVFRHVLTGFAGHRINNATNFGVEMKKLLRDDVSKEEKARSLNYMAAIGTQSAVFTVMKTMMLSLIMKGIKEILSTSDEEDELEKLYNKRSMSMSDDEKKVIDIEISKRREIRKVWNQIDQKENSEYFARVSLGKDILANISIIGNFAEFIPNTILWQTADIEEANRFKELKELEIANLKKKEKNARNLGDIKNANRLRAEISDYESLQAVAITSPNFSQVPFTGTYGGMFKNMEAFTRKAIDSTFGVEEMQTKDWGIFLGALGYTQGDLNKYYSALLKIEEATKEANEKLEEKNLAGQRN